MARFEEPAQDGPVRTCVGCRKQAAKRELLRVTAGSDRNGQPAVVPDPTATAPGRGAHVHPTRECYELAVRRKAFTRALFPRGNGAVGGLSSAPVEDYLDTRQPSTTVADGHLTRNWSKSS